MAKLWAGRFQKETDLVVNDFNSSILFDCRLYKEDITGSIAHATMLGKQGIIEEHEAEKIVEGLKGILKDIEDGKVEFSLDYEDIHMNVEQLLTERIGDTGKRLHTGRSRNDQVALDMRMSRCSYAGLYTSAARTADHVCTLYDGVCQHAQARHHPSAGLLRAHGRNAARLGCSGIDYVSHRP